MSVSNNLGLGYMMVAIFNKDRQGTIDIFEKLGTWKLECLQGKVVVFSIYVYIIYS